jgi:carboxylesterase
MDREQFVNAALWPADWVLQKGVDTLEALGLIAPASSLVSQALKTALRFNFELANELEISGAENVPAEGGVILAANHQSWLDAQVLGAAAPRRPHFIAKEELARWPIVRHAIKLTESVYVRRGGDNNALESIAEALRGGWAVAIFPEGTIPGEEEIPRRAVDPRTGLLPGRTGVARLALAAGVPIVPVGLSGTGRAFPPESYPRLELLRLPRNTPIRIAFGEPIDTREYQQRKDDRDVYRELTDRVMQSISDLVDHRCNYAPIEVPIPECPRFDKIGVLLLHGFTSSLRTVDGLLPYLEKAGIDYEMPVLRGHGTRYQDLSVVTARDWYVDAQRALIKLKNRVDRVVVVGLSMGGLVALELGMKHADKIAGLVTVAPALIFADPLVKLTPLLARIFKYWPSPPGFNDQSLANKNENYAKFATSAFLSLYRYGSWIAENLRDVVTPIRIIMSKKDQVVAPRSANIIYEKVSSPRRELLWYEESGHEMMQDLEAEKVFADIMEFVRRFQSTETARESHGGNLERV